MRNTFKIPNPLQILALQFLDFSRSVEEKEFFSGIEVFGTIIATALD